MFFEKTTKIANEPTGCDAVDIFSGVTNSTIKLAFLSHPSAIRERIKS